MTDVQVSKSITVPADVDEVWVFVSDFAGVATWQPHIKSVEMQSNGDRKVNFTRGDSVLDRVTKRNDVERTFTYGLVPGQPTPMKSLDATFAVRSADGGAEVEYTIEVDVPEDMAEMARGGIGADIDGVLAGLAAKFNG
jgi:carbon monoxide dehydrogenase subunit G